MPRSGENITKRKDGHWEARVIKSVDCKEKTKYVYLYAKPYAEVKQKNRIIYQLVTPPKKKKRNILLNSVITEYLQFQQNKSKASTVAQYKRMADIHIRPYFGEHKIEHITTSQIELFTQNKLLHGMPMNNRGLSAKSVRDILTLLKAIFVFANEQGYCNDIPVFSLPRRERVQTDILSEQEEKILWKQLTTHFDTSKLGVLIALCSGLRIGEICALRWEDIDLKNKTIQVRHTLQRISDISGTHKTKLILDSPKSDASNRVIPIVEILLPFIHQCQPQLGNTFVLTGTMRPIEPSNYYTKYQRWLKESNLIPHSFHALRHTFATRCIENGGDAKALSEILGHSDINITLSLYVHPSMDFKRYCMNMVSNHYTQSLLQSQKNEKDVLPRV